MQVLQPSKMARIGLGKGFPITSGLSLPKPREVFVIIFLDVRTTNYRNRRVCSSSAQESMNSYLSVEYLLPTSCTMFYFLSNYCFEIFQPRLSAILKQLVNWPNDRLTELCGLGFQLILTSYTILNVFTIFCLFRGLHLYVTLNVVNNKDCCRGDITDLYSGGTYFESRVGHWLTCFD
jgi:hypothetical protein